MQQKRLLLALLISIVILALWSYFFVKPQQPPTTNQTTASVTPSPGNPSATVTPAASATPTPVVVSNAAPEPQRMVVIKTPLYEAKLDSRGAEVVSWIIKKNKDSGREIHSVAGSKNNPQPLELVSSEGLKRQPRQVPLQVVTGDYGLDATLAASSYSLEGVESSSGDVEVNLSGNEKKSITFSLRDAGSGLDVVKTIVFDANNYTCDLELKIKRGDQVVPAKLKVGPSIGDQGVKHYTFYSVAPEGIGSFGDKVERHTAASINENKTSPDRIGVPGLVDWGAVGDTYFSMVAIPSKRLEGLEFRTIQYDYSPNGKPEKRYLTEALVPVPTDGSKTVVYVGPKDHFILTEDSRQIGQAVGRTIDLEGLIDYGWFTWLSRPIAVPILKAIRWLYRLTSSYGVAIIIFTIVIYSLFFPLKWRSSKAMKKAQKLAPRMKDLQEKIKGMKQNDPKLKELQMEQLRLMKEGNPLGGCLPLLIQMPFLFALYRAITISLDFRQASFLWLPDLSAGDPIHILEFLMAGTMIVLQLITPAPSADPMQRKMMAIGMPLFMLYVLWGAPSGLLVYWLVGNIVGFSQQFIINRLTQTDGDTVPAPARTKA
ncbi:MAG TPA: membrane protein insertase YidC [Pyrinomonadaceae bacterium]|nr:membrane protein insertase YidC [Pyrinomonadaceae bacterium]